MLDVNNFDSMRIGLASPEQIRKWSHGEVKKPETINYRTLKPEREGLFCEKIFGPTRDWECHCGKYKRIRYKGIICDRCGVEVTRSKVRRDRMGHIELAASVSHIWYFKGIPSRMGLILDISPRSLEKVLYFASYIVIDPGDTPLMKKQLLNENEYRENREKYSNAFKVGMGAEAIKKLLEELDLEKLSRELRQELKEVSGQRKIRAIRRLEVVEAFRKSGNNPAWMIMDVVPVIPPELRPMVQLDGGRFATSDLNDLYRRVINRNNRLKRLLDLGAPDIIVRNEKRMLQEAVDALIDNGRRGRPVTGPGNRPLKSLSDMLKGKQGRFRQNLLGKRVDYSGRSVIVVGPELKLHQCGLPKEMALELFKPFVMKKLVNAGHAHNIKSAKRMVERVRPEVWDVLEEVIKEHPVLLNRAPTLHRLGIQAFEPVLSEGRAIKIHPLVCTAYNADFDGDQMAVHVPLSAEAQAEARMLMLSAHNILSTKDGKPVATPTQDMVLGSYYLSIEKEPEDGKCKYFANINEALLAYNHEVINLHEKMVVRMKDFGRVHTTVGRMIFNEVLPPELRHYEYKDGEWHLGKLMDKKQLGKLVADSYRKFGNAKTAVVLDGVKRLGFSFACRAGVTIAISDIIIPGEKKDILAETEDKVDTIDKQYRRGLITEDERYKKVIDLWTKATDDVTSALMNTLDRFNPVYMMANSGARGNIQQIRQLAGMRGLMADPSGRIIDLPIKANFREGLTVLEYFISTHGARKGLADTALRTADSGYLTRRLVDVAQDVIVREEDCDIVSVNLVRERARLAQSSAGAIGMLKDTLIGRILVQDVFDPKTADLLLAQGTLLNDDNLRLIGEHGVPEIIVRGASVDTEEGNAAAVAETISLGEPEEKVRMALKEAMIREMLGKNTVDAVKDYAGGVLVPANTLLTEEHIEAILASDAREVKVRNNNIKGIEVEAITEGTGVIESLKDRIVGRVCAEEIVDPNTGEVIVHANDEITEELADQIVAVRKKVSIRSVLTCRSRFGVCIKCYGRNLGTGHMVDVGEAVGIIAAQSIGEPGTQLTMRTFHTGGVAGDDITQGLPRVEELFEARKPKRQAIITEVAGKVEIKEIKGMRRATIYPQDASLGEERAYQIPYGARLIVNDGQLVEAGERLTEGAVNPHDILRVRGLKDTQRYLVYEVQKVYKSQGVEINDKHIEVMVRQMLHKVKVEEAGDTYLLPGEYIDINTFEEENARAIEAGGEPSVARPILLGITKASLATDSFLSAASFQETTRVLTEAAIKGKVDPLLGLKENVIIGKLVPAGTGMSRYRNIRIKSQAVPQEVSQSCPPVPINS
ncbi:MAG TPA: DNA-directed RNA polymerase subunit beta' [Methylomusa anaerophila]|uniref:DNA-directed RNA polymerase subunit beta' n=1 Tax=Methylomusa anaerophila TaxID=1930071 RepID=A0A348AJV4_9FIRM|nr:DNA-directed RNA polymerase subunit beta' [Methylomusa anaerophila]BBB91352.1 DNA-directed RNA polymerase subunit beta' [Methylomusa anaerophila]HML90699.1 DNA-directed RNA polymerase subunit beta' [Methylomusa anaerophila]